MQNEHDEEIEGGQRFGASNFSQEFSKVEDLSPTPPKVIGYYTCVGPKRYLAFDAEWEELGQSPSQQGGQVRDHQELPRSIAPTFSASRRAQRRCRLPRSRAIQFRPNDL